MCLVKSPWGEGKAVITFLCLQTLKRDKRTPWGEDLLAVISCWAGIGHLFCVPSTTTEHRGTDRQRQAPVSLSWEITESTRIFVCPRTGTPKLLSHQSLSQPLGGCRAAVGAEAGAPYPWAIPGLSPPSGSLDKTSKSRALAALRALCCLAQPACIHFKCRISSGSSGSR